MKSRESLGGGNNNINNGWAGNGNFIVVDRENGKIIEETNYIDGKKEKEHLFYDEKEKLIKTEIYKNDVKQ